MSDRSCLFLVPLSPSPVLCSPINRRGNLRSRLLRWLLPGAALLMTLGSLLQPAMAQTPAPLVIFPPGTESMPFTGFADPQGVAVDSSGNIYIADAANGQGSAVYKETLSGGSYTQTTIGSGFFEAWAVAVDNSGNVYVADFGNEGSNPSISAVYKETPTGGGYTQTKIAGSFVDADGVAIDSSGNIYVADFGCPLGCTPATTGGLYKLTLSGGGYTQKTIVSGLDVSGVGVDSSGNIYFTVWTNPEISGAVYKETLSGGNYTQSTIDSNFITPESVTVTPSGILYVTDDHSLGSVSGNGIVYQETPTGGGAYSQSELVTDLASPEDVALGGTGNFYIVDITSETGGINTVAGAVYEENYATPPSLSFANTNVGSTSATQTVTITNIGNAALGFEIPNSGNNPSISSGFTLGDSTGDCPIVTSNSGSAGTLASGASCSLVVAFAPQATGSYSGSTLVLTDNNANTPSPYATQTIDLNGTGTGTDKVSSLAVTGSSPVTAGVSTSITVKADDALGKLFTGYTGTVHFTSSDAAATLPANSTLTNGTGTFSLTLKTTGLQTVTATDTATSSVTGSIPITVNGGVATHLGISAPTSAITGTSFGITVSAYDAQNDVASSYSGTVHFTSTDGLASLPANSTLTNGVGTFTATLNTMGDQTITATDTITPSITGTSNIISVGGAPVITSASSRTFTAGSAVSFTVTTTGSPTVGLTEAGALPSGVSFVAIGNGTATLSGTPTAGSGGIYPIIIAASNEVGMARQNFTLTVDQSPAITSASSATFAANRAGTFTITSIAFPVSVLSESGALPSGVTFTDNGNGTASLAGTPGASAAGSYPITITAANGIAPAATQSFTLTINPPPSYVVTTAVDDASGVAGNCTSSPEGTCSLRDALAAARAANGAAISFDPTVFAAGNTAAQNTITLTSTLNIPSNTTITGSAAGITIAGGGPTSSYLAFEVADGVTGAAINGLTITNAYNTGLTFDGGAFYVAGALTVTNSTISGNAAQGNSVSVVPSSSFGGGFYVTGSLTLIDSTVAGNSAGTNGGGIFNQGSVSVIGSTIANNTAGNGGGLVNDGGTVSLANSILSGNSGGDFFGIPYSNSGGNEISVSGISLAPLGNYGGPTQTMIPLPGSAAICAINPSAATGTDQRGEPRTTTYGAITCQDSGAVQTNYALSFSTDPPANIFTGTSFGAGVTLDESGSPFVVTATPLPTITVPLTLNGSGTLTGGSAAINDATGIATYSGLQVSQAGSGDTLTANLTLNPNITPTALSISATSSTFGTTLSVPTVTAINPKFGVLAGGSIVTITGTNFTGATGVQFGGASATSVTVVSNTTITATSPAGTGTVDVTVTTPSGTSATSVADQFVYEPAVVATVAVPSVMLTMSHAATPVTPVAGSGGTAPLVYTISPGLPNGLAISSMTGAISGTPSGTITATTYTVTVTDKNGAMATNTFILTVNAAVTATLQVTQASLTKSFAITPFTPVQGSGGTPSLSYSVSPGLPSGLSLNASNGAVSGTPSVTSMVTTYTVTVTDANGATASNNFALTVNGPVMATTVIPSIGETIEISIAQVMPVVGSGGTGSLHYTVSPTLPPGMALSPVTGTLSGLSTIPTPAITYTVTVTDANGATATATFSLAINFPVTASTAIPSKTLTQNQPAASFTPVTGADGSTPLSYSVSSGLPAGLTISSATGTVTGSPTGTSAPASYTVTVTDANGSTAHANFSLTVNPAVAAAVAVASKTLTQNLAASFTPVTGGGGTGTLTYSISPGLPSGLSLSTSTGIVSGTPSVASAATMYTVTVTDTNGATATASFSLTVDSAVVATVTVPSTVLTFYQATAFTPVMGSGGDAPLTYSVSPMLPAGLGFNTGTGAITGTPTVVSTAGTYTVTVTDTNGATATAAFSLAVAQQLSQTVVSASPSTATPVQTVTLSATVSATVAGTLAVPSGTVMFYDNGTALMSEPVAAGVAQLMTTLPPGQTAVITATYSGDGNFLASASSNLASVVVAPLDFTFTNTGTSAYTAAPGAVASYNFALAPLYGSYAGPVSFSVTGLPAGAVASFTPSSVAANGGPMPVVMTVQTATAIAHNDKNGNSPLGRGIVLALLLLPFGMKRKLREKLRGRMLLLVLLMAGLTATLTGCGSSSGFTLQSPGTYTLTVTAIGGTLQHSQTVTLIVQ
jgi:CSLREA domain-containing protein